MQKVITSERIPIKLWLEEIDEGALKQARNLANLPFAFKWIAVMPDSHEGFGMPIGGVLAAQDVIVPNAVGVDIGCGMLAARTDLTEISEEALRQILPEIRQEVPLGFEHHRADQPWAGFDCAPDIPILQQELDSARRQLGTLGGGNHFIEFQQGSDGNVWLMIHSGSRNFGLKTANCFHKIAQTVCSQHGYSLPDRDLAFLPMETREGEEYFTAMNYCCDFARANRALMMELVSGVVARVTGARVLETINIHHNYAALETHYGREVLVHRKGATKASSDTIGIIPGSMGAKSYIVKGLGNPESFESCAHGAGRRMGRKQAIRSLDLEVEQKKMNGILHGLRSRNALDEAPGAYKDIDEVMRYQKDLVAITVTLRPLASIKA
jgi:tRNA-splicing ligase RtcB